MNIYLNKYIYICICICMCVYTNNKDKTRRLFTNNIMCHQILTPLVMVIVLWLLCWICNEPTTKPVPPNPSPCAPEPGGS